MNRIKVTRTILRTVMISIMSVAVIIATIDGFAQSYAGLYDWGIQHGLKGWKAESFPLLIDVFILVGEIGLFLLALDGHKIRKAWLPWVDMALPFATASAGWSVSLYFNIERIDTNDIPTKVTYGIPPVTAMIGLLILLRTVHRYMAKFDAENETAPAQVTVSRPDEHAPELPAPETAGALPAGPVTVPVRQPENAPETSAERPDEPVPAKPASWEWPTDLTLKDHVPAQAPAADDEPTAGETDPLIAKMMKHDKWDLAVKLYRDSVSTPGKPLSQRDLAAALGMANRQLAKAAIDYVTRENEKEMAQ